MQVSWPSHANKLTTNYMFSPGTSKAQPPRGLVGHCTSGSPLNPPVSVKYIYLQQPYLFNAFCYWYSESLCTLNGCFVLLYIECVTVSSVPDGNEEDNPCLPWSRTLLAAGSTAANVAFQHSGYTPQHALSAYYCFLTRTDISVPLTRFFLECLWHIRLLYAQ